jgi:hypothetical protein
VEIDGQEAASILMVADAALVAEDLKSIVRLLGGVVVALAVFAEDAVELASNTYGRIWFSST